MTVSSDTVILREHQQVQSDTSGYVEFDLIQGATVRIEFPGRVVEMVRTVTVPAQANIDFVALVFPYLSEVTFDDGPTYATTVGQKFTLDVTGLMSNGEEAGDSLPGALTVEVDDETVLMRSSTLTFRALKAGIAIITISDVDTSAMAEYQEPDGDPIVHLNHPTITLDSITVTVT